MNQQQHPADVTCIQCRTSLRRSGVTHTNIVYSCLCGATTREVARPGKRIIVQRSGSPNDAA